MPVRNYSTLNHNVFPRIDEIVIRYPASGVPEVEYVERDAVVLNGKTTFLDSTPVRYKLGINPPNFTDKIQLVNPVTGDVIPDKFITLQELLLGMTAAIRNDQNKRDTANDPVAPTE